MTFSLVGRCEASGQFGVVISSSSPAVAARCAFVRAGVGAVSSQNITDPRLGPQTLDAIAGGLDANDAVSTVTAISEYSAFRQLLAIDTNSQPAIFTGTKTLGLHAEHQGKDAGAAGNLLANKHIPAAMVDAFHFTSGHLGDRLIAAIRAGLDAGGEAGEVHSAGLMIAGKQDWPIADLRCDWTDACPIKALSKTWNIYKPQIDEYVTRALHPDAAPSYGVPGDP